MGTSGYPDRVDAQRYANDRIEDALAEGELEPQRGVGEPIANLTRDPDWWVRAFLEREQYADQVADMTAFREAAIAEAVHTEHLADARASIAEMNAALARWNENAPEPFKMEQVSEIWLITERARTPGR